MAESSPTSDGTFETYMNNFTEMFATELFLVHQADAHVEVTSVLADCVEAGLLVWGDPLRLPLVRR